VSTEENDGRLYIDTYASEGELDSAVESFEGGFGDSVTGWSWDRYVIKLGPGATPDGRELTMTAMNELGASLAFDRA
jgi:hypothetical protein